MSKVKSRVFNAIDNAWNRQVAHLQGLVRERSTLGNEAGVQRRMESSFREMGLDVQVFEPDVGRLEALKGFSPVEWGYEGRPNVVGVLKAKDGGGRSLILNGHLDVVSAAPEDHWNRDPWAAEIIDDSMYGRGALDMKAGVNAYTYAVRAIQAANVGLKGDLILQAVIEEECTGNGTLACFERGYTADGALIPEPFPGATVAQVGVLWCLVKVRGCAAHVKSASAAVNAIEKTFVLMQGMRELEARLNEEKHPAYEDVAWPINFNPGIIRGGDWPSTVPSECMLQFRMGFYPGMPVEEAKKMVRDQLLETAGRDPWLKENPPEISFVGFHAEGMLTSFEENPVIQTLKRSHEEIVGTALKPGISTATTDARFFNNYYGIPATCYGPMGAGLHGIDEYVELSSLRDTTRVIASFILEWCGVANR